MEIVHNVLTFVANGAILLFEFMGVLVILISGFNGARNYFRKNPFTRLKLAQGMAMGYCFGCRHCCIKSSINLSDSLGNPEWEERVWRTGWTGAAGEETAG